MNKSDFINELDRRLQHIKYEERSNIISYYSELIDDLKENGHSESSIINRLDIDKIVDELNLGNVQEGQRFQYHKTIFESTNEFESGFNNDKYYQNTTYQKSEKQSENTVAKANKKTTSVDVNRVIIAVLTFPIWLPLIITLASLIFAVAVTYFALCVSAVVAVIACVAAITYGIATNSIVAGAMLMDVGGTIALIGIVIILIPIMKIFVKAIISLCKSLIKVVKKLFITGGSVNA